MAWIILLLGMLHYLLLIPVIIHILINNYRLSKYAE
jgi:hypothetical protein